MNIRAFSVQDYDEIAEIFTLATPDQPVSADYLAISDEAREPNLMFGRVVADTGGKVVGVASWMQYEDIFVSGEVYVNVRVHPAHQRRGIGAALYDAMIERLRRKNADTLKVTLRSDRFAGMNFAVRRGFTEYARRIESRLALAKFDPGAFPAPDAQMAEQGLVMRSLSELATDPDRDRKIYDLKWQIEQDVTYMTRINRPTFESFQSHYLNAPVRVLEGSFAAMDGDRYVGLVFHDSTSPRVLMVDLTGTAREYRRRGIAQALKVKSMSWAKSAGYGTLVVHNDLANTGMLAINDRLGYTRQPALILLQRKAPF